jgi:hypothetical protein
MIVLPARAGARNKWFIFSGWNERSVKNLVLHSYVRLVAMRHVFQRILHNKRRRCRQA